MDVAATTAQAQSPSQAASYAAAKSPHDGNPPAASAGPPASKQACVTEAVTP